MDRRSFLLGLGAPAQLLSQPAFQPIETGGPVQPRALAYFYATGSAEAQAVYRDAQRLTPHKQPVMADDQGAFPPIYLDPAKSYRLVMTNSTGEAIRPVVDPVRVAGTSGQTFATVPDGQRTYVAETVAAVTTGDRARAGDGGGARYLRVSKAVIDEGDLPPLAYFRSADRFMPGGASDPVNGGYWLVQPDAQGFDVRAFGALSDDATDCSAAFDAAARTARASGTPSIHGGVGRGYYLGSAVDLTGLLNVSLDRCPIRVSPRIADVPITLGGFAITAQICDIRFAEVRDGRSEFSPPPPRPILRIMGVKNSRIQIGSCNYVQFYADAGKGAKYGSTAYNTVHLTGIQSKLELTDAGGFSWVNENTFYASRVIALSIEGRGYAHNHNKVWGGTFEGKAVEFNFKNCSANYIYGARGEEVVDSVGVSFDQKAFSNAVIFSWSGAGNSADQFRVVIPVRDLGQGNLVTTEFAHLYRRTELFNISPSSVPVGTATSFGSHNARLGAGAFGGLPGPGVLKPGLRGVGLPAEHHYLALTEMIPVERGDVLTFEGDYAGALLRPVVFVFGGDQLPLTSEELDGSFIAMISGSFDRRFGRYAVNANLPADYLTPVAIIRPEVKYLRVGFVSGRTGAVIRHLSASIWTQSRGRERTEAAAAVRPQALSLDGAPTRGFAPTNTSVWDRSARLFRWVSYEHETFVRGAVQAGGDTVTVADAGSIADGDLCGIVMENQDTHWSGIARVAGSTFTIAPVPRGRAIANGARIVFNRWAS